jgi:hypothetical protein
MTMLERIKALFKDYSWDFHMWSQEIPIDTHIDDVKRQIPSYIEVDWQNPETLGKGKLYPVIWIKGHKITKRRFLGFVDELYSGCIMTG